MITPQYLEEVSQKIEELTAGMNAYLVAKIAKRISETFHKGGKNIAIPSTISDMHKIMRTGELASDIVTEIEKQFPNVRNGVKDAFTDASKEIVKQVETFAQSVELDAKTGIETPKGLTENEKKIFESIYDRTNGEIKNITRTMPQNASEAYVNACDNAFLKIKAGVSPDVAIKEAIEECAKSGLRTVTYFNTQTGVKTRTDRIEVAIARAVRTGINQANAEVCLMRCAEMGVGYVKTSQHLGARVTKSNDLTNHAWWQGKAYKLDFEKAELSKYASMVNKRKKSWFSRIREKMQIKKAIKNRGGEDYKDFVDTCGYGNILGICGINCRHTFAPFYPYLQEEPQQRFDEEENKKRYALTQKQRAMERRLRELQRRIVALEESNIECEDLKIILKEEAQRYNEFCAANGLSRANWRIQIA